MVGSVTAVSLVETVGVPGPQAGPDNGRDRNFAAAMRQAGDEAGTALPTPSNGLNGSPEEERGGGTRASHAGSGTAATQADTPMPEAGKRIVAGQPQTTAKPVGAMNVANALNAVVAQEAQDLLAGLAQGASAKNGTASAGVQMATAKMPATPGVSEALSASDAPVDLSAVLKASVAETAKGVDAAAASLQPKGAEKKTGKEAVAPEAKAGGKPGDSKVDSRMTALIAQGMAAAPQMEAVPAEASQAALVVPVTAAPVQAPDANDRPQLVADAATSASLRRGTLDGGIFASGRRMVPMGTVAPPVGSAPARSGEGQDAAVDAVGAGSALAEFGKKVFEAVAAAGPVKDLPVAQGASETRVTEGAQPAVGKIAGKANEAVVAPPTNNPPDAPQTLPQMEAGQSGFAGAVQAAAAVDGKPVGDWGVVAATGTAKSGAATAKPAGMKVARENAFGAEVSGKLPMENVPLSAPALPSASSTVEQATPGVAARPAVSKDEVSSAKLADGQADGRATVQTVPAHGPAPQSKVSADDLEGKPAGNKEGVAAAAASPMIPSAAIPADHSAVVTPVAAPANSLPHTVTPTVPAASRNTSTDGVSAAGQTGMSAAGSLPHTMLSATPTSLEVGVSSGTHGWLKIRAELNAAGEVNASLTGTNAAAADKLRSDLPALNSYLQSEKVVMGVVDVRSALHTATASFEGGSTFSQSGQSGAGQPGHGQSGQGNAQGGTLSADAGAAGDRSQQQGQPGDMAVMTNGIKGVGLTDDKVLLSRLSDTAAYGIHTELGGSEGSPSLGYGTGGGWLNVRA